LPDDDSTTPEDQDVTSQDESDGDGLPSPDETAAGEAPAGDASVDAVTSSEDGSGDAGEETDEAAATANAAAADEEADGAMSEAAMSAGGVPEDVAHAVGESVNQLISFAQRGAEVLSVGLESVTAHHSDVQDRSAAATEYASIESEFAEVAHVGFELRVALSETEAHLVAALLPVEDVGALFMVDMSADLMENEEFAKAQLETVSNGVRELLDLVSLTLFAGGLAGAEVTLSDVRLGQIDFTMGMLADVAQGVTPVRADFALSLADDGRARVTLVVPADLLSRIAGLLDIDEAEPPGVAESVDAGTPYAVPPAPPPASEIGFGLSDEALNVTPLRPDVGGVEDGGVAPDPGDGADVPVHPVRFPPLGAPESSSAAPQSIDMIMDVSMRVTVELGRSTMMVEEVLALGPGSVVELNKLAGEPVDILVNERLIARGEVVVVDENFGVRVTEIVSPGRRAQAARV
jgi:flagellar motor switch protein FliN